ncbi:MAG TPA: hypothetical protein VLU92_06970 [Candidatus Dormibacteraeota bacterium]|nr:hypothetical protein [Candidatus Dormibacteraeota bacterium]
MSSRPSSDRVFGARGPFFWVNPFHPILGEMIMEFIRVAILLIIVRLLSGRRSSYRRRAF